MRAINHALTGAVIGLLVDLPVVAGTGAIASHFICDIIPHYGANLPGDQEEKSLLFRFLLYADAGLCISLVLLLFLLRPNHWLLAAICAFLAAAPDFLSFNRYLTILRGKKWRAGRYMRFAIAIQWFERPIGVVVETAWFIAALILLVPLVR